MECTKAIRALNGLYLGACLLQTWHAEDGMPTPRCLSAVLLLDDNHAFNGALMVIPGSHTQFVACGGATPADNWRTSLKSQQEGTPSPRHLRSLFETAAQRYGKGIEYCEGKAGDVILFDCNLMHGSHSNISPLPRRNVFAVFNAISNAAAPVAPYAAGLRPEHIATREPQWVVPATPVAPKPSQ